ncbi:hypothetical protein LGN04_28475 [Burkholderia multivorans]|uniref:hypothetical protein n=1 Tax=Burkholderia multivorans TaxID=87883 RepID=UPI0012FE7905|nr:hypothetical protein [Burkholderia multivorans]MBU9312756.1 hypothetical protein [Burkholderia multivorans]MBU9574016.1 hypothetical protein [Burkholderia multivorans]MCA8457844.1 hypothetical protein [Burkholderia multivorans]MDN7873182.1 hypothetical protein [Burkholderia multivorans]MDN7952591.1 hypothetical protein [Burkholderia multivorans]
MVEAKAARAHVAVSVRSAPMKPLFKLTSDNTKPATVAATSDGMLPRLCEENTHA